MQSNNCLEILSRKYRFVPFVNLIVEHESYGTSAYFSIYLHVCRDGKQYYLPGNLLLSMRYFNRAKPVVILKREGSKLYLLYIDYVELLSFNHSIVRDNGIVHTQFLKEWEKVYDRYCF